MTFDVATRVAMLLVGLGVGVTMIWLMVVIALTEWRGYRGWHCPSCEARKACMAELMHDRDRLLARVEELERMPHA